MNPEIKPHAERIKECASDLALYSAHIPLIEYIIAEHFPERSIEQVGEKSEKPLAVEGMLDKESWHGWYLRGIQKCSLINLIEGIQQDAIRATLSSQDSVKQPIIEDLQRELISTQKDKELLVQAINNFRLANKCYFVAQSQEASDEVAVTLDALCLAADAIAKSKSQEKK